MKEITHGAHQGATRRVVWLACARVAKSVIGTRSLVHMWEGEESEVEHKVHIRHCKCDVKMFEGREYEGAMW